MAAPPEGSGSARRVPGDALWDSLRSRLAAARQGPPLRRWSEGADGEAALPPLSPEDEEYWSSDLAARAADRIAVLYPIDGPLDAAVLERSLVEVVRRAAVLRTVYLRQDGRIRPVLLAETAVRLPVVDCRALPDARREVCARRLAAAEVRRGLPQDGGPLAAFMLVRLAAARSLLLAAFHHWAFDGWSLGVFSREVSALYESFAAGRPSPLPEPPLQFADFVRWQLAWLSGPEAERQNAWWRQALGGAPLAADGAGTRPALPLPAVQLLRPVPAALAERLRALAAGADATPFMIFLAALAALLHAGSGRTDLCLGTVAAGRTRSELQGLIGCFVNNLVLRVSLAGDPPFGELLLRVRTAAHGAFAHADVPLGPLLRTVAGRTDDFWPVPATLLYQNLPPAPLRLNGREAFPIETQSSVTCVPLMIYLVPTTSGLQAQWQGRRDLFDAFRLANLAAAYEELLRAVAAAPGRRLSTLPAPCEAAVSFGRRSRLARGSE